MKFTAIHQLTAGFVIGDAISLEIVAIRDLCRALGCESEIFVPMAVTTAESRRMVRPLEAYRPAAPELLIYHYSIQSAATDVFRAAAMPKVTRAMIAELPKSGCSKKSAAAAATYKNGFKMPLEKRSSVAAWREK